MKNLVNILRSCLPTPVKTALKPLYFALRNSSIGRSFRYYNDYHYDAWRFSSHAASDQAIKTQVNLRSLIILNAHCIEKGLSHHNPRTRFGQQHIVDVLKLLAEYSSRFGQDQITAIGFDTLAAYIRFHQQHGIQLESLEASISKIAACNQNNKVCSKGMGGAYEITRARIYSDGKIDIVPFLNSRHSIRHFDSHRVDQELIRQAVSMAITTPSVCNRQAWKARVFHDDSAKNAILAIQNGNRGFTELIDTVLIVTCDLDCFMSVAERNQPWIDGGMFSMTLLLALHSVGLGACCLNWCVEKDRDMQLRKLIRLPESEVVIMIIAVGHIPEKLMVARSARKPLEEVLFFEG